MGPGVGKQMEHGGNSNLARPPARHPVQRYKPTYRLPWSQVPADCLSRTLPSIEFSFESFLLEFGFSSSMAPGRAASGTYHS